MEGRAPKRLTARRKFEVYLAAQKNPEKLGEVLRRYGLHLNDLRAIEVTVEAAAVEALKVRRNGSGGRSGTRGPEYEALVQELSEKEQALAEMTLQYALLRKSERSASRGAWKGSTSTDRAAKS